MVSVGSRLDTAPNVIDVDCRPGTPIVFSFGSSRLIFHCQSGATVGVDTASENFSPSEYLQDPLMDEDAGVVQYPIHPFLHGRNGYDHVYVDSITLIERTIQDGFDGIAAVVLEFDNSTLFGFSAIYESHFCFAFNDVCRQLLSESNHSESHTLHSIKRVGSSRKSIDSVLWMVN